MAVKYQIEVLKNTNGTMTKVAEVKNPVALNKSGSILQFTKELSDFGICKFRISAYDTLLDQYGDIFTPHQYHVRLKRNNTVVWSGAVIDNSKRTKDWWLVECAEYEWYLSKIMVNRNSIDPSTGTVNGIYRIFNAGAMDGAVRVIINETIANYNQPTNMNSILAGLTIGTIQNPNFPPNMTDNSGASLAGGWSFSNKLVLQYDFQSVLYVLKSMGTLSYADFQVTKDLVFNFYSFLGKNRSDTSFVFNKSGSFSQSNIIDYNLPRLGQRMVNHLWGIATDTNGTVLHVDPTDQASLSTSGLLEGVAAYSDVNDQGILATRTNAQLNLISTPDTNNVTVVLNETTAYPLGLWDVGDIVPIRIKNKAIDFSDTRRIVGASVDLNSTGREMTTVQTNKVLPWQYAMAGS